MHSRLDMLETNHHPEAVLNQGWLRVGIYTPQFPCLSVGITLRDVCYTTSEIKL